MYVCMYVRMYTATSKKLHHGCRMFYAGSPSFLGLGLEDGQRSNVLACTARSSLYKVGLGLVQAK